MKCNIDAKGKAVRLRTGILLVALGVAVGVVTMLGVIEGVVSWASAAVLVVFGAVAIFEGRAGWCAVRAMGFKTPI